MSSVTKVLNAILTDPSFHLLLVPLHAARNGLVYGGRIRFAHALVMALLFKKASLLAKLKSIFKATSNHATALALFALLFKAAKHVLNTSQKHLGVALPLVATNYKHINSFLAGGFGAFFIYSGKYKAFSKAITQQITLYCFSRVVLAIGNILASRIAQAKGTNDLHTSRIERKLHGKSWFWFSITTWAAVMWLNDYEPDKLMGSLRSSMVYIYEQDRWNDWHSFFVTSV